jgi:hypothetical protein
MFTLSDHRLVPTCAGFSRRDFLTVGSLALGGLSLPQLFAAQSATRKTLRDKAVVLLFLSGGPSHIEFFDPKMTAPEGIRSITGEVKTKLPGITFGGSFEQLARRTDRFTIVRSFASGNGGHTYESVTTGGNPLKAAMGAIYSRLAGSTNATTGMPSNVLVKPEAVDPELKLGNNFETGALPTLVQPGELGASHTAFDPAGGGQLLKNLRLSLPAERFDDRKTLLRQLDTYKSRLELSGEMESASVFEQRAFDVLAKGIADAFDLRKEDPRTIAKYDTSKCFEAKEITKWYDMKRASNLLGKQMLMARRLVEAGAGFVTVSDCGWDMHANNNSPANMTALPLMAKQVDHAVSAFLDDLHERGLSDKVLLVVTGEMGRTPRLNKNGGRDHWANLTTLLLAGGGVKGGQVIGASDKTASSPATTPYKPTHLLATVLQTLFDGGELRIASDAPKNLASIVADGTPIPVF